MGQPLKLFVPWWRPREFMGRYGKWRRLSEKVKGLQPRLTRDLAEDDLRQHTDSLDGRLVLEEGDSPYRGGKK